MIEYILKALLLSCAGMEPDRAAARAGSARGEVAERQLACHALPIRYTCGALVHYYARGAMWASVEVRLVLPRDPHEIDARDSARAERWPLAFMGGSEGSCMRSNSRRKRWRQLTS